ncbi:hypothetical protein NC653_033549 [Populus alba x Populus x berolinensis]|uniref:Uncharacterized protein n=1 Tax=Populus alba x Populus x berolinensis TaxID=444605 RepID=A0AAD6LU63_9ROSI|nr:hypothetical protein NC653_033549 [Populus alba x Populus x berolinensis]
MEYCRKMDHPSNGVSIMVCLRPSFADEESYLKRSFHCEDSDGYNSDWKVLWVLQSVVSLQDFQDAEPDVLAHSTSAILEHFSGKGSRCNVALKALCKKKGLHVEGANLVGIDSLGMDVRIFSGVEARTHRFPFKVRVSNLMHS